MKKRKEHLLQYVKTAGPDRAGTLPPGPSLSDEELAAMDHINRKIAGIKDLRETIGFLFRETQDIFPCDRIGLAFFEETGQRLHLRHVIANYSPLFIAEGYNADIRESSLKKIFTDETPRIINDLPEYSKNRDMSEATALLLKEGVVSNMTCPLLVDGRPVAVLFRSSRKRGVYTEKEVLMHGLISERLSQAVEKTYRIEQLNTAINDYMEMLGFITHELKSPVDSIIIMGKTLEQGYIGELSPEQRDYIRRITKKAEHLSAITADYLNLSRFESGSVSFNRQTADFVKDISEEACDIILPQAHEKGMIIEKNYSSESIIIECDPTLLKIVMVNLLSNAVKYGNDHGLIRLTAGKNDQGLDVAIWNQGPGFSFEEKKRLFRKFPGSIQNNPQNAGGPASGCTPRGKLSRSMKGR